ncbi:hypothetical protein [Streptomyces sp. NPDC015345]|uniref:hypothetical protein n=1 Tax=Streptomyces sp. NPDC015345 TaxID=3364953 RepID=UPI0036F6C069
MRWGNTGEARPRGTWSDVRMRAAGAACAAQLPVAGMVAFTLTLDDDSRGTGGGPALGLACLFVFGPLLLPVVGLLHSAVLTLPAVGLGRLGAARLGRGPEWAWSLACLLPVGAAWAACFAVLGAPFVGPALWIAAGGILPALHVAYCRRREERLGRPLRKVWILSGLTSLGVCVAVFGGAVVGTATGLIKEYEPPELTAAQLAGTWRGGDDERLRLGADGRAVVTGLPYESSHAYEMGDAYEESDASGGSDRLARCDSTGTWRVGEARYEDRPAVVIAVEGCGSDSQTWTIGGTAAEPELFVLFGDPDSPDIEVLVRRRG